MILTTKYDVKKGYTRKKCSICGRNRITCQHHIDGRRYSDEVIDVCTNGGEVFYTDPCHAKIHNPIAFGLPSTWAYDNGYLRRHTNIMKEKKVNSKKWAIEKKRKSPDKWKINKKSKDINKWRLDFSKKNKLTK